MAWTAWLWRKRPTQRSVIIAAGRRDGQFRFFCAQYASLPGRSWHAKIVGRCGGQPVWGMRRPWGAQTGAPSRAAITGCVWERASGRSAGLAARVERCDYGDRTIHLYFRGHALIHQFSDPGARPDTVVESFEIRRGETPEAAVRRVYLAHTRTTISDRCMMTTHTLGQAAAFTERYTFAPNAAYAKALKAKKNPNEVPDPPCGDWGTAPDGNQYFQISRVRTARRVLFVRVGPEAPLFDELTLQLLPTIPVKGR